MLVMGRTIGVMPIKLENREGTDKLKELIYEINDHLYANSGRYLFQNQAEHLYDVLCDCGKRVAALQVPDRANAKKSELLTKLRTICNSLKNYKTQSQNSEDLEQMQKAINWTVHLWIEARDTMTPEKALELLKMTKEIRGYIFPWDEDLKTGTLVKANSWCLNFITEKYQI